jgi:RimJ/RimL family protein N-acetyltransferase/acyl carrier protein
MLTIDECARRLADILPGTASQELASPLPEWEVYFEILAMSGLEEMHRYSKIPAFYDYLEFEPFCELSQTRGYIEKLLKRMDGEGEDKTAHYWFIRRKADNYLLGTASLVGLDYKRQSVIWGYGVDPELWGGGYILQIQEILKHYVFEVLQLNRLSGITMINNQRTIASLLATGMQHEGTIHEFYNKNGSYIDGWQYSMLRSDYLGLKTETSVSIDESALNLKKSHYPIEPSDIIDIVASVIREENISLDSGMDNVMSWDSLNHMAIMVALHENKGVKLEPAEISRATSIKSIVALLEKRAQ